MSDILNHYRDQLLQELAKVVSLPMVAEQNIEEQSEDIVLRYTPITIDRNWMNDEAAATSNAQYNKLKKAINNLGVTGIADIDEFLGAMNNFVSQPIDASNHSEAISRVDVLRTFYHLLTSPNEQSKGYDFEHFLAHVFGGRVIPAQGEPGITDVHFPGDRVSISAKFIKPGGVIKGSMIEMQTTVDKDGSVSYLVGTKGKGKEQGVVRFFLFVVDRANFDSVPVTKKGQMNFSIKKLRSPEYADKFQFQELSNSPLDLRGCLEVTEKVFEALDKKFQGLLREMQDLVNQVDDLLYSATDDKETKQSAGAAKKKAEKVRASAQDIETTN